MYPVPLSEMVELNEAKGVKMDIKLFFKSRFSIRNLNKYLKNKNEIIFFTQSLTTIIYNNDIKLSENPLNDFYDTIIIINYNFNPSFIPNVIQNGQIYIFPFFSFFKIINVEINKEVKNAKIILNSIGRTQILEEHLENSNDLLYDSNLNIIYSS